ncbi:hypothetical protein D3C86_1978070 [compost metagenome]
MVLSRSVDWVDVITRGRWIRLEAVAIGQITNIAGLYYKAVIAPADAHLHRIALAA